MKRLAMRGALTLMPPATALGGHTRWWPVVASALLALSCTRDPGITLPPGPACPTSGISGRVAVAGQGQAVPLRVRSFDSSAPGISLDASSDDSGRFQFPLDAGSYELRIMGGPMSGCSWSAGAPSGHYDSTGVVIVERGEVTRTDFAFGQVVVHLTVPRQFDGRLVHFVLARRPTGNRLTRFYSESAKVVGGEVTLNSRGVPADVYRMRLVSLASGMPGILLPGVLDSRLADSVVVRADATTVYETALAYSTSIIRGEIRGSWERSGYSPSPWVTILTEDSLVVGSTATDAQGGFLAEVPYARRVRVNVSIGTVDRWVGGQGFRDATTFALDPSRETEVPLLTESGLLIRLVSPDPWMSVEATFELADEQGRVTRANNGPAAPDQFLVSNLIPGSYRLFVAPRTLGVVDWQPQWYDLADSVEGARVVVVPPDGGIASAVVQLERGGEIAGVVRDALGAPRSDHAVMVTRADSFHVWTMRPSETSGVFRIRGLPDGNWKVAASEEAAFDEYPVGVAGETWIWYGGSSFDSATVIAIRDHATVDGIEIRLP